MTKVESPSQALSKKVVARLIEAGLLRKDREAALIAKIASGKIKGEDWKLEVELAAAKGAKE